MADSWQEPPVRISLGPPGPAGLDPGQPAPIPYNISTAHSSYGYMHGATEVGRMTAERGRRISAEIEREGPRLRNFVRRRVANDADVEDILQDVFSELVEA